MKRLLFRFKCVASALRAALWSNVCCPCGWSGRSFAPLHEGSRHFNRCPNTRCLSVDRQRLYRLYLEELLPRTARLDVLHIAPEMLLMSFFRSRKNVSYVSADLDPTHVMKQEDVTRMSFPDSSFDFIFCAHVLEHIQDDASAMQEMYRVLRSGGRAILQVPLTQNDKTYEDPSITDPAERRKAFGQEDHVRKYGRDYTDRLRSAGFAVEQVNYCGSLPRIVKKRFGLRDETIFLCTK